MFQIRISTHIINLAKVSLTIKFFKTSSNDDFLDVAANFAIFTKNLMLHQVLRNTYELGVIFQIYEFSKIF